jgi:hypothetical protein
MNWLNYFRDNLAGAGQVLLGRPEGLNRLDTSLEGFWRSFGLIIIIAPLSFLFLINQDLLAPEPGGAPPPVTGELAALFSGALIVDWFAFPFIFALLAPSVGLASRYVPFIVARNWAALIIAAASAIVEVTRLLGILPVGGVPVALIVVAVVWLRLSYLLVRTTLVVSMTIAIAVVALDFLVSRVIMAVVFRML